MANHSSNGYSAGGPLVRQVAVLVETETSWGCSVIRGIADYAEKHGHWNLLIGPHDHEQRLMLPDRWQGDGIIARLSSRLQVEQIREKNVPTVNVDDLFEDVSGVATVCTDETERAQLALAHLLDKGFRQFGYFAPPSNQYSKKRGQEFVTATKLAGYDCHEYKPGYRAGRKISWEEQQRRVERWLASLPRPVAVLAVDALRARQLADICHLDGLSVPDDIAILSGDTDELMCDVLSPPLSSISVASQRIGHDAARLLQSMMDGEPLPDHATRIPPLGVTSRQSTDVLAIDDPTIVGALRFIESHADRGIVVEDVLRVVPISRRSLEIQFRHYLGRSPAEEIRRVRLEKGRELLARADLSVAEIATSCGFTNATRFGVALRKRFGEVPLAYRKHLPHG